MEAIEPYMALLLSPLWVPKQQMGNGRHMFQLLPASRLQVASRHLLTTFVFNNIPA
jgi:hypothetical protein